MKKYIKKLNNIEMIVIGGSAGSFNTLLSILEGLEHHVEIPIIFILHRLKNSKSLLEKHLQIKTHYKVKEAEDKELIQKGTLYTVPSDYHLLIEENRKISLDASELVNFSRPSIDVTFISVSKVLKEKCCGILLSGSSMDGAKGLKTIVENGGIGIVQDIKEAEFEVMPLSAINIYPDHKMLNHNEIIKFLNNGN
jgi:two-component system, chemotaxis family, protein-glutamate methylesterase/glutaminase